MAAFEGSHKSLLQGVSQQVARERLDGQVAAQNNMLSDPVTNLRRRPGAAVRRMLTITGSTSGSVMAWDTDIGGYRLRVLLDRNTGTVRLLDEDYADLQTLVSTYLIAADRKDIQATTVGENFVMTNLTVKPTLGAAVSAGIEPTKRGWFYIKAGSFSKTYTVTAISGAVTRTATYTTPNGATAGDAARSTPEYIANQLYTQFLAFASDLVPTVSGAFVHMTTPAAQTLTLSTDSYSSFVITSGAAFLQSTSDLPARLPPAGDGYIIGTTSLRTPVYFQYNSAKQAWLESGAYGSPAELLNMPVVLRRNDADTAFEFDTTMYEGRYSGDDESNPVPGFVERGITGTGSFQGRLVLLSGPLANLSGSGNLHRWFRSTGTEILDSDPIQVGASANSSAAYRHAAPFQKDLLLFSDKYQALIPSGNVPITPRSANVVITSTYEADMAAAPVGMGRTLAYATPRSADFFGVLEVTPSQYTDSQYTSNDVTAHIPKYMPGRCRWAVSSSVANMVLFGSTGDAYSCTVHEYLWSGPDKIQQAWHKWTFPYPISDCFFSGAEINFVFVQNEVVVIATLDPRAGELNADLATRPFLDLTYPGTVVNNVFTLDATMRTFDPELAGKTLLSNRSGTLGGEWVGTKFVTKTDATLTTVGDSFENGAVYAGIPYRSSVSPTPPNVKDSNDVLISSNKLTILRYMVGTTNSGEYEVSVVDSRVGDQPDGEIVPTLYWDSPELQPGSPRIAPNSVAIIPCRTNAETTAMLLSTEKLQELNITSLEFVCKYNQKLRRR